MAGSEGGIFYEMSPYQQGFVYNISRVFAEPFPLHVHDVSEFIYISSGEAEFAVEDRHYTLHAGDVLAIFPLVPHEYVRFSEDADGISMFLINNAIAEYQTFFTGMRPVMPLVRQDQLLPGAEDVLRQLKLLAHEPDPRFSLAYLHLLMSHLFSVMELQPVRAVGDKRLSIRVIEYITENYRSPLQLQNTAEALGISTSHLSHIMSQQLGVSFRQYINTMRVNYAKALLAENRLSIAEISEQCGYLTQRSFNRSFHELCGITPGAYREQRVERHLRNQLNTDRGEEPQHEERGADT